MNFRAVRSVWLALPGIFFETRLTRWGKCGKIVAPKGCLKFNFMIFRLHECHHIGFTANGGGGVPVSVSLPGNRALALFCRAPAGNRSPLAIKGGFFVPCFGGYHV